MTADRDPRTRIVLSWLREDAHENAERVLRLALDEVDATPQRRSWWPVWRADRMNTYAKLIAAAAAVLVVAIGGFQLLPLGSGSGGPTTASSPSPSLIARGTFVEHDHGPVEFEATRDGSGVTGHLTAGERPTVDLHCTLATEDGVIMIGGATTDDPEGTLGWIALKRGSPDRARVGFGPVENDPATEGTDCLAYLDAVERHNRVFAGAGEWVYRVLDGTVEVGP